MIPCPRCGESTRYHDMPLGPMLICDSCPWYMDIPESLFSGGYSQERLDRIERGVMAKLEAEGIVKAKDGGDRPN